jgi:secreted PhoX family phosphatase
MTCRPSTDCTPPEGADDDEDVVVNDSAGATIGDLIAERLNRRDLMTGALASSVVAAALPEGFMSVTAAEVKTAKSAFSFTEVRRASTAIIMSRRDTTPTFSSTGAIQ